MTILRSKREAALNDLHVSLKQSADHFRDAAEFLQDDAASALCRTLAGERDELANDVAATIRADGELPSAPDPDLETGEQLLNRLQGLFSADQTREILQQRCEAERELLAFLRGDESASLRNEDEPLLQRCCRSVESAIARLQGD